jgi:hypothetical protein
LIVILVILNKFVFDRMIHAFQNRVLPGSWVIMKACSLGAERLAAGLAAAEHLRIMLIFSFIFSPPERSMSYSSPKATQTKSMST